MTILQQKIVAIDNEIDIFVDYVGAQPNRLLLKPFQPNKANTDLGSGTDLVGPYAYELPSGTTWTDFQVEFPFGPQDVNFEEYAAVTKTLPRPGKVPLLVFENPSLRTITCDVMVADKESHGCDPVPVIEVLDRLELLAANAIPCKFIYGVAAVPYAVTITKFGFTVKQRNTQGNPTQVEVSMQLTETPVYDQKVVQLAGVFFDGGTTGTGVTEDTPDDDSDDLELNVSVSAPTVAGIIDSLLQSLTDPT